MKAHLGFIFSLFLIFILGNCTNMGTTASCQNKCNEKQNICFLAIAGGSYLNSNILACEVYRTSCYSSCVKSSSKSSSTRSSSSRSSSSRASSGSRSSSGGSSSSSSSGSSGGSGGSSHSILADAEN